MFLLFIFGVLWIGVEAKYQCISTVIKKSGRDCVSALSEIALDETESLKKRNKAIWTLGVIGDQRAASTLASLQTQGYQPSQPVEEALSQEEIQNALDSVNGRPSLFSSIARTLFFLN